MEPRTHLTIDRGLCGTPSELVEGRAAATLDTTPAMAADALGLVHGGFVFGLADHAAMLAVNHPHVVLASAEVEFLRPVRVGERVTARATVTATEGKRRTVECVVEGQSGPVFRGRFQCVVPGRHVLERREAGGL